MRVKIGDNIFDSEKEPIMLIFENDEQKNLVVQHLSNIEPKEGIRKYAQFPDSYNDDAIKEFMKI